MKLAGMVVGLWGLRVTGNIATFRYEGESEGWMDAFTSYTGTKNIKTGDVCRVCMLRVSVA